MTWNYKPYKAPKSPRKKAHKSKYKVGARVYADRVLGSPTGTSYIPMSTRGTILKAQGDRYEIDWDRYGPGWYYESDITVNEDERHA